MRSLKRRRPRYAEVTATLALLVALSGTSYAVTALPRNSVGAKQLKPDAVRSSKVHDGSLTAKDFAKGQLPAGATGAPGPKGDPGAKGDTGPAGAAASLAPVFTDYTGNGSFPVGWAPPINIALVPLPPGNYLILGNITFHNPNVDARHMRCEVDMNTPGTVAVLDNEEADVASNGAGSISTTGSIEITAAPAFVVLNCFQQTVGVVGSSLITFQDADLIAVAVGPIS